MAAVTSLRRVATRAASRLRLGFDGVARHKIGSVNEFSFERLGVARRSEQRLREIVAFLAIRLGMTGPAQLLISPRLVTMVPKPGQIVFHERLRFEATQVRLRVTRGTDALLELLLMLVTLEALRHLWKQGVRPVGRPSVTPDALAANAG